MDDDWLKEVYKIALKCHEDEIGVYGARVIPLWQDAFPDWLSLEAPYSVKQEVFNGHSHGDTESFYPFQSEYGLAEFPSGVNVLIRREIFENCGDFRSDLGASAGGGFATYDDFEFFEYLSTLKIPMLYLPQCIVFHPVNSSQMTIQFVRRWYFKAAKAHYWIVHTDRMKRNPHPLFGIAAKYRKLVPEFATEKINGIPIYLYLKLIVLAAYWLILQLSINAKKRNYMSYQIAATMGEIEAAEILSEAIFAKKFSFKDRLIKKGLVEVS